MTKVINRKFKTRDILYSLFLWIYALFSLYPLIWMLFYSFKTNNEIFLTNPFGIPTKFHIENYINACTQYNVPKYFLNSIIVTVTSIVISIVLSLMFSYATARMQWKLKGVARIYLSIGMFIPVQAILIPLAIIVRDLHLTNNYFSLILPYVGFQLSFTTMVFYGFFRSIPGELEESACIDGAGIFRTFVSIMIPTVKPAIATMVIFNFLNAWNEFPIALILIADDKKKTLPLGLLFFQGQFTTDWGAMGAAMVIASLPTVLVYIFFSNKVEKALTVGGAVKG